MLLILSVDAEKGFGGRRGAGEVEKDVEEEDDEEAGGARRECVHVCMCVCECMCVRAAAAQDPWPRRCWLKYGE